MRPDIAIATLLLSSSILLLVAFIYIITRKNQITGIKIIAYLAILNCGYMFFTAGFVLSESPIAQIWFSHLQYLCIPYFGVMWFLLSVLQKRNRMRFKWWHIAIIMIIPAMSTISNFLYPATIEPTGTGIQLLFFQSHELVTNSWIGGGYSGISFNKGIMYYTMMGYNTILAVMALANYYALYRKSARTAKKRALIFLLTCGLSLVMIFTAIIRDQTLSIDVSPFFSGMFSLVTFILLIKFELFDLIPLAYRQIFTESDFPILILDDGYAIIEANKVAKHFIEGRVNENEHLTLHSFEAFDPGVFVDLTNKFEHELTLNDHGEERIFFAQMTTLYNKKQAISGYTVYYQDITEHKNELRKMEIFAEYDDLTKIYNRRYFFQKALEYFDKAIEQKQTITVIMFDLDDFKSINDIYGHQAGDYVLQEATALISKELTDDYLFARYGGEEFIIFQKGKTIEEAKNTARVLCENVAKQVFVHNGRSMKTSASFGVAGSNKAITQSLDNYIKEADDALYMAKSLGKKQIYVFRENE
ncbi:MAG: diguanylate cyclase [Candidatus Izemoplasmatales bacterium]